MFVAQIFKEEGDLIPGDNFAESFVDAYIVVDHDRLIQVSS